MATFVALKFGLYPLFRPIFDWRIRLLFWTGLELPARLFDMVKRIGHGADWGRGVEQLHVGVVGLAGLAVANTVAVVVVERSIVVYKQSPDLGRLSQLRGVRGVDFPVVLDQR